MENPNSNMNRLFATAGQKQTQQGTGYTNLNRVFQANQGNKLGQKVVGGISTQLGGAKSALQQEQDKFKQDSEANRLDTDANKNERAAVLGRFTNASSAGGDVADEDVNKFQQFRSGEYKGPSGLGDTSSIQQTASGIAQQTSNFSPSGTKELLRRSVGGNRYTQGQTKLDSLLLDRSALTPISRQAQGLTQDINRASLGAQGQAQALSGQAKQFGQETNEQLTAGLAGLDTAAQEKLTAAQTAETNRQNQLQKLMNTLQGENIPKLDAAGNPVLDANGNPVMEKKLTGTTDPYARFDEISGLLKDQGLVNQNQYEALFGKGTFSQNKSTYDKALQEARKKEVLQKITGDYIDNTGRYSQGIGSALTQLYGSGDTAYGPEYTKYSNMDGYSAPIQTLIPKVETFAAGNQIDLKSPGGFKAALSKMYESGALSENDFQGLSGRYLRQNAPLSSDKILVDNIAGSTSLGDQLRAKELEAFKSSTGLAGRSTLDSKQDDFYKTLAQSLAANTKQAEGLTKAGVAGKEIKSNYAALQKLLGQAPSSSTLTSPEEYKAGQINLDAAQIKRALGY